MYVKIRWHQHTRVHAHTGPRGAKPEPELWRVTDTTSHGLSAGRHSTQTTIGSPSLCDRPKGGEGGAGSSKKKIRTRASRQVGFCKVRLGSVGLVFWVCLAATRGMGVKLKCTGYRGGGGGGAGGGGGGRRGGRRGGGGRKHGPFTTTTFTVSILFAPLICHM